MKRQVRVIAAAAATLVAAAALCPPATSADAEPPDHRLPGRDAQVWEAVDAIAVDDVWAVGTRRNAYSLVKHWDGTQWRAFSTPEKMRELYTVAHVSSTNVWAGGSGGIMHWDGSAWTMSWRAPGSPYSTAIASIVTIGADDAWAVGYNYGRGGFKMHWDGTNWTRVGPYQEDSFYVAVDADRADDVWAVSFSGEIERWNGRTWKDLPGQSIDFSSVAVLAPDDVWLAGNEYAPPPDEPTPVILHWDGHGFTSAALPDLRNSYSIDGLDAATAHDIWAVGGLAGRRYGNPVTFHWDGSSWDVVTTPKIAANSSLNDVSALTPDDAWAVGDAREHKFYPSTITEHWDGSAWTRVD